MNAKNIKLYLFFFLFVFVWIIGWNSVAAETSYVPTETCSATSTPTRIAVPTATFTYGYYLPITHGRECIEVELICFAGGYCQEECVK
jgi:hypothetical protein